MSANKSSFKLNVQGYGCVSSVGLDASSLYQTCVEKGELPVQDLSRECGEKTISYSTRPVDKKSLRSVLPKHPRLRRSSGVTKFSMAAVLQALDQQKMQQIKEGELSIGIIVTFLNGCVNYSNKFYSEVLEDPSVASPILFPETVYNAPAGHIASLLESDGPAYSMIGDTAAWFTGLSIANDWIDLGIVDGCLIISAEELDWLSCEGLDLCSSELIGTEGAAAVYVDKSGDGVEIEVNGSFDYRNLQEKAVAMESAFTALPKNSSSLLINGQLGIDTLDKKERSLTSAWQGNSIAPFETLGHPMAVTGGFQTVVGLESLKQDYEEAVIFAQGSNQHAYSAILKKKK